MLDLKAAYKKTDAGKEAKKRYKSGDAGKAADKRYKSGDSHKAAYKRYKSGDAGKAAAKRYHEGDAGQAATKRRADHRQDRRRASPAIQLDSAIQCASHKLISGSIQTSPTFVQRTGFESAEDFLSVVYETFVTGVMTFSNHGTAWHLDHKIPREAYDFDNPVDIKRCWSAKNVHAMTPAANMEKSWKLIDQYVAEAGVENFPVAWQGKFPDNDFKIAHAAKMMAQKMIEEDTNNQPSGSNDFGPIEAPDSDSDSD